MMWRAQNASEISRWYPWVVEEEGVYEYTARFEDYSSLYQPSNEARLVVVAEVVPVSVLFDVQPKKFKPGDDITLIATVFDAASGLPLPDKQIRFYVVDETGNASPIGNPEQTNASGVATLTCPYHIGPNAYFANASVAQTVITSPVMLTAAEETRLSLDVDNDGSDYEHTFSGCLLSYGEPVLNRQVKILVNDTVEAVLSTAEPDGSFSLTLNLQPADDKPTTYNVQAVFEGDEPYSATAYDFTPNDTEYALCTTLQYFGFKPVCNTTWLTVEPQATQVMTQTKTPEQLRQEAEQQA
jgi:hypothetical protein